MRAVPVDTDALGDDYKRMRRLSRPDEGNLIFGGNPPPCLDMSYEVTIKDRKDAFHAICMMKVKTLTHYTRTGHYRKNKDMLSWLHFSAFSKHYSHEN